MRSHLGLSGSLIGGFQCVTKFYSRDQQRQTPNIRRALDLVWVSVANIRLWIVLGLALGLKVTLFYRYPAVSSLIQTFWTWLKIPKITWYETQLYIIPNSHNSINYQHQPFYSPYSHSYPRHRSHYRLPRFKTDILVSINTPLRSELNIEALSPLSDPVAKEDRIHVLQSQLADRYGDDQSEPINILLGITKSLRIHNTGLFVI